ncbi:MAG: hypothetical protein Q4C20_02850 [Erysipelotrichaceae bacterium]|jgi:hypothetical protein|nr:hypothetical protein [Erysipelotrichaceae bacterium]
MISPKLKKILSGIMIAGDILLGAVFFADLISGGDPSVNLFLLGFLGTDALLSLDYISRISKEEREALEKEVRERRYVRPDQKLDAKMAQEISESREALDHIEEMSPEELAELLQKHEPEEQELYERRRR